MIDKRFVRHVIDYMPHLLPRPRQKLDTAESLNELEIIKEGYRVC